MPPILFKMLIYFGVCFIWGAHSACPSFTSPAFNNVHTTIIDISKNIARKKTLEQNGFATPL